ncbi:MAG TPA: hypothetical protein VNK91_06495 [Burkholderiaceae bacterium]|nr:hypothetical protein [Burkholderiaceae bacterium]
MTAIIRKIDWRWWFRQKWLTPQKRWAVLTAYKSIDEFALADIAQRGYVFSQPQRVVGDVFGDGINEGRRQLALEIIELAGADVQQLFQLIERKPNEKESGQ